jgi:hypothetical protein
VFDIHIFLQVLSQIKQFKERAPGTRVVLVPSTRDLHHHPVLPQPPLPTRGLSASACANPCTLRLNEVVVGIGAQDWLMAANREEVARTSAPQERLPALAAHLPAQASFFPMFPPPLGTPLDCSRAATALRMSCVPDMLLLPSDLAPFAKLCPLHQLDEAAAAAARAVLAARPSDPAELAAAVAALQSAQASVVCVNPGRLTKGATGWHASASALPTLAAGWLQNERQLAGILTSLLDLAPLLNPITHTIAIPLQVVLMPTSAFSRYRMHLTWKGGHQMCRCCTNWLCAAGWTSRKSKRRTAQLRVVQYNCAHNIVMAITQSMCQNQAKQVGAG